MKKLVALAMAVMLSVVFLAGCGANEAADSTENAPMQYTTAADVKEALDSGKDNYVVLDVRQDADFQKDGIAGAYGADMHEANKEGDLADGEAKMKAALKEATGSETSNGEEIVLVCYSGKSYAQAGTNALDAIGVDVKNVYTLEGGMEEWAKVQ